MVDKNTENKIQQLQMIEQSLQNFLGQKQQFQAQLVEIESALGELKNQKTAYKIIGNVMVETDAAKLKTELTDKMEVTKLRIKNLEKQENEIKEKAKKIQNEVLESMKKEEKK